MSSQNKGDGVTPDRVRLIFHFLSGVYDPITLNASDLNFLSGTQGAVWLCYAERPLEATEQNLLSVWTKGAFF